VDSEQQWSLPLAEGKVRRLALQNISEGKLDHIDMSVTRSVNAMYTNKVLPPVVGFELLRVLALEYCGVEEGYLKHIGKLRHLRYLGLRGTRIGVLPEEVGGLEFLQTLMLERTGIKELPKSVGQLTKLMCLRADKRMTVPDWIGKLTSLVELVMYPGPESKSFVKELGKLTELRLLNTDIIVGDEEQARDLLESLSNIQKMETISILPMLSDNMLVGQPSLVLHHSLRKLEIGQLCFPKLPESINQQALPNLDRMKISLFQVEQHDMQIIGKFQNLRFLHLSVKMLQPRISISSGDGFQNLKILYAVVNPPMFLKGAMPSLEIIALCIPLSSINILFADHFRYSYQFCR
jgi:disease resistance protein RPM1